MNPLIQTWLDAREAARAASKYACACEAAAREAAIPSPTALRPATAEDLAKIGQVVWYPRWEERKWCLVEEVEHYGDQWKAYTAHDGCRYGLDGAFIEILVDEPSSGSKTAP